MDRKQSNLISFLLIFSVLSLLWNKKFLEEQISFLCYDTDAKRNKKENREPKTASQVTLTHVPMFVKSANYEAPR